MKRYLFIFLILVVIAGCARIDKGKTPLVKINNYEITKEEFEEEFKSSSFGRVNTAESRNEFLENLINRKLILQEAQLKGLDRDKDFLKMVERFWEQSLLKLALDKKTEEIVAGATLVSEEEIEKAYQDMAGEKKTDKAFNEMYSRIKGDIIRSKQSEAMNQWVSQLRKKADIKINHSLLEKGN